MSFILFPAYQPSWSLVHLVRALSPANKVIIVDDGSTQECMPVFSALERVDGVRLIHHSSNLGKGEALKTGLRAYRSLAPEGSPGIVTADVDGQHSAQDIQALIVALEKNPQALHLGVRDFSVKGIPLRSRVGNLITRWLMILVYHVRLRDTQTGLRGVPRPFIEAIMDMPFSGYELEMGMLTQAIKEGVDIQETPIKTLYGGEESRSFFRPLLDSAKIYSVLLHFAVASVVSSFLDIALFSLLYFLSKWTLASLVFARLVSGYFNYMVNARLVFQKKTRKSLLHYALLAGTLVGLAYVLIHIFQRVGMSVYFGKVLADLMLFFLGFFVQKFLVFKKG